MAAGQGFLTVSPDAVYGDTSLGQTANYVTTQKFTMPSSGTFELAEIGIYDTWVSGTSNHKFGVFTHDAVNDCPEDLVANSEITIAVTGGASQKRACTYSTKPQVTGGTTYWLAVILDVGVLFDGFATSGWTERAATYPTWPTAGEWETHAHFSFDLSLYAVYQAVAAAGTYVHGIMRHHTIPSLGGL